MTQDAPATVETDAYDPGYHNKNMDASIARIVKGGSWKKQRIIRIRPSATMIHEKIATAHEALIVPPNQGFARISAQGMEVGEAYSMTIEGILAHPDLSTWEYILTLETDNAPPPDGVLKLLARMEAHPEFAAISGCYWTKGPGGVMQAWGDPTDPVLNFRPQAPRPGELVECCGTGMGFVLWRLGMFKDPKLRRPWFKTVASAEGTGTQDLYFWSDARKHGYRCAVDCDVLVGHYDHEGTYGIPEFMW